MSQKVATTAIDEQARRTKALEQPMNSTINNFKDLKLQSKNLEVQQKIYFSPNAPQSETYSNKMLKMQKQDDIRSIINYNNNIIIFTGMGLVLIMLLSMTVYKSSR